MSDIYSKNEQEDNGKSNYIFKLIKKPILSLLIIGIISLTIRLYYFPFEIPIIYDGIDYFSYAVVINQQGHLPLNWDLSNNGWSIFLSFFFSIFESQKFLELTYLQRFLSIIISVLTIIPVYLLCARFVKKQFAVIGAALFVLEPRIIINSLLGIPEPAFILLSTISLFLFLSKRYTIILISFFILALCSTIRYEGFLLLFPFLIIFVIRFRKDKKIVQKILLCIVVFFITISPVAYLMYEANGNDGIISPIIGGGINYISTHIIQEIPDVDDPIYGNDIEENRISTFLSLGIINTIKFLGWILIPTFLIFVPMGIILLFQKRDYKTFTIILCIITMLIPPFYAYARGIEETRYLYIIFPILCIISSLSIEKISKKIKQEKIIMVIIISGILVSSLIFLDYKKMDYQYEKESYLIANYIENNVDGINHWNQWKYIPSSEISNNWPKIPVPIENDHDQPVEVKRSDARGYEKLSDYITDNENNGLTHLVVDGKQQTKFLNDIFYNENIPYLIKQYDSKDKGYEYHVKVFEINYELFSKK
jgi:hypothetical protein